MEQQSTAAGKVDRMTNYLSDLSCVLSKLPLDTVREICEVLFTAYLEDRIVFIFGNGGSAALASHMVCDLGKGGYTAADSGSAHTKRLKVMSLTDNMPMISAWANDARYEDIFAEQMENFIHPRDIAFGISGSGNSPNVLRALKLARSRGAVTLGFTGQGGKMIHLLDFAVVTPSTHMQLIEDSHLILSHMVYLDLRDRISRYQRS